MSLNPVYSGFEWELFNDMEDALEDVIVGLKEIEDGGVNVVKGPIKVIHRHTLVVEAAS